MLDQFKQFMLETNAFSLAIGVVIGGAVAKLVAALVADLLMPVISLILPGGAWREFSIGWVKATIPSRSATCLVRRSIS